MINNWVNEIICTVDDNLTPERDRMILGNLHHSSQVCWRKYAKPERQVHSQVDRQYNQAFSQAILEVAKELNLMDIFGFVSAEIHHSLWFFKKTRLGNNFKYCNALVTLSAG